MSEEIMRGEVVIYTTPEGESKIEVKLEDETVWISQAQMAEIFGKDVRTVNEHIQNVYKEGELQKDSTIRNFRIVRNEGERKVSREIEHYSLDVIISVGYRVKSLNGTQFRIWANGVLKNYLVKGYAINDSLLIQERQKFTELRKVIDFINKKKDFELLDGRQKELIEIINEFAASFSILSQYDEGKIELVHKKKPTFELTYDAARKLIDQFRIKTLAKGEGGSLLASEIDDKFKGIIGSIYQTYGGEDLYASLEEKAANILYLVIKDHPFSDGNKRIGSLLFVYYLDKNGYLYKETGEKRISQNALVAIALLVAVSDPRDKEVMIKIVTNLLQ
jgi:prophage maintenance system killer protein